jgi:hypothetical protein
LKKLGALLLAIALAAPASAQTLTWVDTTSTFVNQADGFIIYHCAVGGGFSNPPLTADKNVRAPMSALQCVPASRIGTVMVTEYPVINRIHAAKASATEPGKTNCFAVTAFNAAGESPKSETVCIGAPGLNAPLKFIVIFLEWLRP